jgi:hypothetical protein
MKEMPGSVFNALREKFQKSDALNYLKELVSTLEDKQIEEFTCTAMMAAYQKYRLKSLDYMLGLEGRHEAKLIVKIQIQKMMFEKEGFESEKEMKVLLLICKHFDSTLILNELDFCKQNRPNDKDVIERHKELSYVVLNSKLSVDNKKEKKLKI